MLTVWKTPCISFSLLRLAYCARSPPMVVAARSLLGRPPRQQHTLLMRPSLSPCCCHCHRLQDQSRLSTPHDDDDDDADDLTDDLIGWPSTKAYLERLVSSSSWWFGVASLRRNHRKSPPTGCMQK